MMLDQLTPQVFANASLIQQAATDDGELCLYENEQYRWFTLGGSVIQSLMAKHKPESLILPVPRAMLTSLLWQQPTHILNLGMGAGSIERCIISTLGEAPHIVSVEKNKQVIDFAKHYFYLPKHIHVENQDADDFVAHAYSTQRSSTKTGQHPNYDLVLVDLFSHQLNPDFISQPEYFQKLSTLCHENGVVAINAFATNEQALVNLLINARQFFNQTALISFDHFKNIVILLSQVQLPTQQQLQVLITQSNTETSTSWLNTAEKYRLL